MCRVQAMTPTYKCECEGNMGKMKNRIEAPQLGYCYQAYYTPMQQRREQFTGLNSTFFPSQSLFFSNSPP